MALKSVAGPGLPGLPLSTMEEATLAMKASNIPPGELMISWRPISGPLLKKLCGVPLGTNVTPPGTNLSILSPN